MDAIDRVLWFVTRRPFVLVGFVLKPWWTTMVGGYLALLHMVCRKLDKYRMWSILSAFVTFTRVSTGRGSLEHAKARHRWSTGVGRTIARGVPWALRIVLLRVILIWAQSHWSEFLGGDKRIDGDIVPRQELETEKGFTAIIPSCYDGDTCHAYEWRYDGIPLPYIFQDLNIRILGIDAPELRTAKCGLERCLAERAKIEMERIVGAGRKRRARLYGCKHDKYGGRLVCDIEAIDSECLACHVEDRLSCAVSW